MRSTFFLVAGLLLALASAKTAHAQFKLPKAPKIDTRGIDIPKIDIPKIDIPKIDIPKIDIPKIDIPKIDIPKMDIQLPIAPTGRELGNFIATISEWDARGLGGAISNSWKVNSWHVSNAWKVNSLHFSREWHSFIEYFQGIWKTIFETDIVLNSDQPSIKILDVREHQNVKIQVDHIDGAEVAISILNAKEKQLNVQDQRLAIGTFAKKTVTCPEIEIRLVNGQSARIHLKCMEWRSTLYDAFGAGSTINPDESTSNRPAAESSSHTVGELNDLANEGLQHHSAGLYFAIETEYDDNTLTTWFGPYQNESEAWTDYQSMLDLDDDLICDAVEPGYFPRHPELN